MKTSADAFGGTASTRSGRFGAPDRRRRGSDRETVDKELLAELGTIADGPTIRGARQVAAPLTCPDERRSVWTQGY